MNRSRTSTILTKTPSCLLAYLLFLLSWFTACDTADDYRQPGYQQRFAPYISSHSSGLVSVAGPVKLVFSKRPAEALYKGQIPEDIITTRPASKGKLWWQNELTLVYEPEEWLQRGQTYLVEVDLQALFPDEDLPAAVYRFEITTPEQKFSVSIENLQMSTTGKEEELYLTGMLTTADVTDIDKIKKVLQVKYDQPPTVSWEETGDGKTFTFNIKGIARSDKPRQLVLNFDGQPIDANQKFTRQITIPARDEYRILSVRLVNNRERYIAVHFSSRLDAGQNLDGLISIGDEPTSPRVVINNNELKIYPASDLQDEQALFISRAIKSASGRQLAEDYQTYIQFSRIKPQVRLLEARNKVILPSSNGLVFPFAAAGLQAVDVIVYKIYPHNILQYLQVNGLGGDNELYRVAKPIVKKTIDLNSSGPVNLHKWNRFTLDLSEIINTEPGALYRVMIGFSKKHSLYACGNPEDEQTLVDEPEDERYWEMYEQYYPPYFDWSKRDDPCSRSYYGRRRAVYQTLLASDLGLIAKKGSDDKVHVFVTNLLTTQPLSGVKVQLYNFQQELLGSGTTDDNGMAVLAAEDEPFVVVADYNGQAGYLKVTDGDALSVSNFDVSGTQVQQGLKGFIYGERGVWRPADTVHLAFILQRAAAELPAAHPVIMKLYNPSGQLLARQVSQAGSGNIYRFDFPTSANAPTGNWQAVATVGGASFRKTVKIETIKPNRLKISFQPDKEAFTYADGAITGNLDVRWLTGANAGNLKVEYEMLVRPAKTTFKDFPLYTFDDPSREFYSERQLVYSGQLNEAGQARIRIDMTDAVYQSPGMVQANLYGKVYEPGGDFSISTTAIPYYPYSSFAGLKLPAGDSHGMLLTDEDHRVDIVTVDANGKPVNRQGVKVKVYKLDWRWWWDNSFEDVGNYINSDYQSPEQSGTVNTVNGRASWTLRINKPAWGRYYVQVTDPVSGHSAGKAVYIDWPGWAGKAQRGDLDGASMLQFEIAKESYQVGDEITVKVPSTPGNRILVSLETGSRILQSFWQETSARQTVVKFKATPEMAPNVYVHLTMLQPHGQEQNNLPMRLYGIASVKVVEPASMLQPLLKVPDKVRPEQSFSIEVQEKDGRPMSYTLAVVDEGLLDITSYKTPAPWAHFYAREALGVKTWDIYDDVIGAYTGQLERLLAIGGDEELQAFEPANTTNRFKPVVFFLGPFNLAAGQSATHRLTLPPYTGRIKTMLVAASEQAYGHAEATTLVKQPLMLLATLPRVAGPNEKIVLPVNVFAEEDNLNNVKISVETNDNFTVLGDREKTISFSKSGDKLVTFTLRTGMATDTGKVVVRARSGKHQASYAVDLRVIPRNPPVTYVKDQLLEAGTSWQATYQPAGIAGHNRAAIELSNLPPLNLEKRLGYLINYPHGCIEQTVSAAFAQLYLPNLTDVTASQAADIEHHITAAINKLNDFQVNSGGFSYWPGQSEANIWGSNYAGHFMLAAEKAGYAIPAHLVNNWLNFQRKEARNWRVATDADNDLAQAYRLYTLALAGKPEMGAMNRLRKRTGLSTATTWRLALAYAIAGYDKQAVELLNNSQGKPLSSAGYDPYTYGSPLRDRAMQLETLLTLGKQQQAYEIILEIANALAQTDKWLSTQTTAYCLLAISQAAGQGIDSEPLQATIKINGQTSTVNSKKYLHRLVLQAPDKQAAIEVGNTGSAPLFVRLIRSGIPLEGSEQAVNRNLIVKVDYTDSRGNRIAVNSLPQGTNFKATVTVTNPGGHGHYRDMALTQLLPSGWEIINTRLDGSRSSSPATYTDIRDDRVMQYFDLPAGKSITFEVLLNATYQGRYYLPAITAAAMYDISVYASILGRWVEVTAGKD